MVIDELLTYGFAASSAGCAAALAYPSLSRVWRRYASGIEHYQQAKIDKAAKTLDDLFIEVKPLWLKAAYGAGPLAVGVLVFMVSNALPLALAGAIAGIIIPDVCVRQVRNARSRRFQSQLVDVLFLLSSSLRAGLSLTQAFEQVESEMSPPASQEFGLMMKAYRLGLTLEEALQRLNQRMPCEELNLVTTAVLVARETGGDITGVINRLIGTIRERKKLNDKIQTLTLQGRLQAYIMSLLPLVFAGFVRTFNPTYLSLLLEDHTGQLLLALAVVLWIVGMVLLFRMSKVDI